MGLHFAASMTDVNSEEESKMSTDITMAMTEYDDLKDELAELRTTQGVEAGSFKRLAEIKIDSFFRPKITIAENERQAMADEINLHYSDIKLTEAGVKHVEEIEKERIAAIKKMMVKMQKDGEQMVKLYGGRIGDNQQHLPLQPSLCEIRVVEIDYKIIRYEIKFAVWGHTMAKEVKLTGDLKRLMLAAKKALGNMDKKNAEELKLRKDYEQASITIPDAVEQTVLEEEIAGSPVAQKMAKKLNRNIDKALTSGTRKQLKGKK